MDEETHKKESDATRSNIRCDCCNRLVEELKPFVGPGDPLIGDFTGRRLVKVWRYDFSEPEIPSDYFDCLTKNGEIDEQKFREKYGREKYEQTCEFLARMSIVSSYWLCRDCILIEDRNEFCKKRDNCSEKSLHR